MFRKYKFQTRLFLSYFILPLLLLVIIFSLFIKYISDETYEETETSLQRLSADTVTQMDALLSNMDRTALFIASNPLITGLSGNPLLTRNRNDLQGSEDNRYSRININLLNEFIIASLVPEDAGSRRISIYNRENYFFSAGVPTNPETVKNRIESPEFREWLSQFEAKQNRFILSPHPDFWSENPEYESLSLIRGLYDLKTYEWYGVAEIQIPFSVFRKITDTRIPANMNFILMDGTGKIIHSSYDETEWDSFSNYTNSQIGLEVNTQILSNPITKKKEMVNFNTSDFSGWVFIVSISKKDLLQTIRLTIAVLSIILSGALFFTTLVVFILSRRMTKPFHSLIQSVRSVSIKNLSINIDMEENSDVIAQLNQTFNTMFHKLKESMNELVDTRSHEIKAHLLALQSQIDPHFIYNTLSLIDAYSREGSMNKIMDVTSHLSGILRYISSFNDNFVPIGRELAHAESYLVLMKGRYESQLEYTVATDRVSDTDLTVPKLILQPIVENAFYHGFKGKLPPWSIEITTHMEGDLWYIAIQDNGSGMAEDQIRIFFEKADYIIHNPSENIKNLQLGGMGLINIYVRLKLLYKEKCTFHIENNEKGCRFLIGGDRNVKNPDR